jgi:hypothetical protein
VRPPAPVNFVTRCLRDACQAVPASRVMSAHWCIADSLGSFIVLQNSAWSPLVSALDRVHHVHHLILYKVNMVEEMKLFDV